MELFAGSDASGRLAALESNPVLSANGINYEAPHVGTRFS